MSPFCLRVLSPVLLIPDFSLIVLGYLLRRLGYGDTAWGAFEKLTYQVLFPALLFRSVIASRMDVDTLIGMGGGGLAVIATGLLLGLLARPFSKMDGLGFGSGLQCAYRFNSYIALALASRLAGEAGVGKMAVLLGVGVPVCNVLAVYFLARHGESHPIKEMAKNPLIMATVGGLLFQWFGWDIPDPGMRTLERLGQAAVAMGLLSVGAGLRFENLHKQWAIGGWWLTVKLLLCPAMALAYAKAMKVSAVEAQMLLLFASLPAASSAYILTVRLKGDAPLVAGLISISTVASAVTIPMVSRWLV